MLNLDGEVAIVVGAGQEIGREIALLLTKSRVKMVIIDISGRIFEVLKGIEASGREGLTTKCGVSNGGEVEEAVRKVMEKFDGLAILVNNVGIISL